MHTFAIEGALNVCDSLYKSLVLHLDIYFAKIRA